MLLLLVASASMQLHVISYTISLVLFLLHQRVYDSCDNKGCCWMRWFFLLVVGLGSHQLVHHALDKLLEYKLFSLIKKRTSCLNMYTRNYILIYLVILLEQ